MNQTKGFVALTSTAFILGTFGVLIRLLSEHFTDTGQVLARSFFASLIILLVIAYKRINPISLDRAHLKYLMLFSLSFPMSIICFTISANQIKVSNSLFMLYVGSLISTAFFGKYLFKEKFTVLHGLSLFLVFIGLLFFVYPFNVQSLSLGILLGVVSGITEGASHTLRKLMNGIKREVVVFYQSISGVVVALLSVFLSGEFPIKSVNISAVVIAIIFGALLVLIGALLFYGFNNFNVNLGTVILATELFFSLVINYLFLHESPTIYELIGGVIIFLGSILTSIKLSQKGAVDAK